MYTRLYDWFYFIDATNRCWQQCVFIDEHKPDINAKKIHENLCPLHLTIILAIKHINSVKGAIWIDAECETGFLLFVFPWIGELGRLTGHKGTVSKLKKTAFSEKYLPTICINHVTCLERNWETKSLSCKCTRIFVCVFNYETMRQNNRLN